MLNERVSPSETVAAGYRWAPGTELLAAPPAREAKAA